MCTKTSGGAGRFPIRAETGSGGLLEPLPPGGSGGSLVPMSETESYEATEPPIAHVRIDYMGPVAPHWDIRYLSGDQKAVDDFRTRVNARLLLLPKYDPQFRRNRERVNRDAERENIGLEWDLGDEEPDPRVGR